MSTSFQTLWSSPPCAGVGLALAAALPAGRELQNFWCQLAAVEQLNQANSAQFLQLGNNACFPLDEDEVRGRLIVRRCYDDLAQLLEHHFSCSGRSFIVTGNAGQDSLSDGIC